MTSSSSTQRLFRLAAGGSVVLLLGVSVVSGSTFGALSAGVDNTTNTAASATMLYTHSYGTQSCTSVTASVPDTLSIGCAGTPFPTTSLAATSPAARADTITANGTIAASRVTESVSLASCGIVQLANRIAPARPMVARYGTSFAATGPMTGSAAITVDGAAPGGYETAVTAQTQPTGPAVIGSATYGLGIWFKAAAGSGGALFGFGSSAANATASNDRMLFLTTAGKIGFVASTAGTAVTSTATGFNNNAWHLAYVRIDTTRILVGLGYTVTIFVDGTQVATGTSGGLGSLTSYSGYWHVGWSPVATASAGAAPNYFAGSLSNFVVLNDGNAPTTLAVSTTQGAFDTSTASATEHWRLDDTGTATYTGTLPVINANPPCGYADITWQFANPTSCAVDPSSTTSACTISTTTVAALAAAGARTVATVATGTPQTSTITLARDATYTGAAAAYLPGLIARAPITFSFQVPSTGWATTFSWTSAAAGFVL